MRTTIPVGNFLVHKACLNLPLSQSQTDHLADPTGGEGDSVLEQKHVHLALATSAAEIDIGALGETSPSPQFLLPGESVISGRVLWLPSGGCL